MAASIDGFEEAIDFYFDFSSPYGYFAATRIEGIAAQHGRSVTWRPILLGAVFKVTGQQPLPTIPIKGAYARHDVERTARLFALPFKVPTKFPVGSTACCRAFYALSDHDPGLAKKLALGLYAAYFAEDRDISSPEVTLDVAAELGASRDDLARRLNEPALKDRVRAEVDDAIAHGVFGSPYFILDGEAFWGCDRLDQVERWLATGGW